MSDEKQQLRWWRIAGIVMACVIFIGGIAGYLLWQKKTPDLRETSYDKVAGINNNLTVPDLKVALTPSGGTTLPEPKAAPTPVALPATASLATETPIVTQTQPANKFQVSQTDMPPEAVMPPDIQTPALPVAAQPQGTADQAKKIADLEKKVIALENASREYNDRTEKLRAWNESQDAAINACCQEKQQVIAKKQPAPQQAKGKHPFRAQRTRGYAGPAASTQPATNPADCQVPPGTTYPDRFMPAGPGCSGKTCPQYRQR